jgi:invasion protein IalB
MKSSRTKSRKHPAAIVAPWITWLVCLSAPAAAWDSEQLAFSHWKKFCLHSPTNADQKTCFKGLSVTKPSGIPVAGLTVIEGDSSPPRPLLRVIVPLLRDLRQGLEISFDRERSLRLQYATCDAIGCYADTEAEPELMRALSAAHQIHLRAPKLMGETLEITIPSQDFASVFGAPYDFKVAEEEWNKTQEARKKEQAGWGGERSPILGSPGSHCPRPMEQ